MQADIFIPFKQLKTIYNTFNIHFHLLVSSFNPKTKDISALWEQEHTSCESWAEHARSEFHLLQVFSNAAHRAPLSTTANTSKLSKPPTSQQLLRKQFHQLLNQLIRKLLTYMLLTYNITGFCVLILIKVDLFFHCQTITYPVRLVKWSTVTPKLQIHTSRYPNDDFKAFDWRFTVPLTAKSTILCLDVAQGMDNSQMKKLSYGSKRSKLSGIRSLSTQSKGLLHLSPMQVKLVILQTMMVRIWHWVKKVLKLDFAEYYFSITSSIS